MDRQSRRDPAIATKVPSIFRSEAYMPLIQEALAASQKKEALDLAEQLVQSRPMPAENLSRLALAAELAGASELSAKAIFASASRGWRDPLAQHAVFQSALAGDEPEVAGDRLYALWAAGAPDAFLSGDLNRLAENGKAAQEFAKRLVDGPRGGISGFIAWGADNLPSPALLSVVAVAPIQARHGDCTALSKAAGKAMSSGQFADAEALWVKACRGTTGSTSSPFGFGPDLGDRAGPFDWQYPGTYQVDTDFAQDGGDWVMNYHSQSATISAFATRNLRMSQGDHSIALSSSGGSTASLIARIQCITDGGNIKPLARIALSPAYQTFNIPKWNCRIVRLTLLGGRGSVSKLRLVGG